MLPYGREHPTFVKTGQWARMEGQSGGEQAMTSEDRARLEACTAEIAEILYRNSNRENLDTLEVIEQAVRQQILEEVSPRVALFLSTSRPCLAEAVAVD